MIEFWIGVDVSKRKLDVACLDGRGKIKSRVFGNDVAGHAAFGRWLLERGTTPAATHLCLESTGPYSEAPAIALADAGWRVSVVNPARVKAFAGSELQRNKTDRADAALLARFCARMQPEPWQPPPLAQRQLRALVDRLQALKDMHLQESNRLEGLDVAGQETQVKSIHEHLAWLQERIDALQRQIDDHIDSNPSLKNDAALMRSIPGIGDTMAAKVLAYLGDLRRFSSAKALAAFIGVTPRQRLSGTSVRGRTMMSRVGHGHMRKALFMPAMVALRHNPAIKAFGDRLRTNGLARKAVVGASMRKLAHLLFAVVTSGRPFEPRYGLSGLDGQVSI